MIHREHYLRQIRPFYDSDLVKIITGIRRCGKSVIMRQISEEISEHTDNIINLEFENRHTRKLIPDVDALLDYISEHRTAGKCYIFLDEVQELENWQDACRTLRLEENSVFVTGSNSRLLSKEFTKELSGRFVSFRIRPFVYKELSAYANELGKTVSVTDYLVWGGFPKRLEFEEDAMLVYLEDLDETIILNDIINRYKIKKEALFRSIANFVLLSNSRVISPNAITAFIKSNNEKCSANTVKAYIDHLETAFAIDLIKPYSTRTKQELAYKYKVYDADVSLNSLRNTTRRYDLDHNLENIVYNELLYMGYTLRVYNNNGREIDFLAQKNNMKYYIQVAYSVQDDKAYRREFSAFEDLDNLCGKILITNDELDYSTPTVRHLRLKEFLLMEELPSAVR